MPFRLGPWELILILVVLFLWFIPVFLCVWLAKKKGKDTIVWAILGLFFGLIALLILAILPAEDIKGHANQAGRIESQRYTYRRRVPGKKEKSIVRVRIPPGFEKVYDLDLAQVQHTYYFRYSFVTNFI